MSGSNDPIATRAYTAALDAGADEETALLAVLDAIVADARERLAPWHARLNDLKAEAVPSLIPKSVPSLVPLTVLGAAKWQSLGRIHGATPSKGPELGPNVKEHPPRPRAAELEPRLSQEVKGMTEERETMTTARIYRGPPGGWFIDFDDGNDPSGPYTTEIEAGKVARAVILQRAEHPPRLADGRRDARADRRHSVPDRRQAQDAAHFAGTDRRMVDDRRKGRDHHLDRLSGRNKYAVVNMRQAEAATVDGSTQRAQDLRRALSLLRKHGVLNDGDAGTPGEFFVLMLKDQFAGTALLAYSAEARKAGMQDYADDVLQLSTRAGHGSRHCKLPD